MSMAVEDSMAYLPNAKHGCWSIRTGLEKKLIVFSVVCFTLFLVFFIVTIGLGSKARYEPQCASLEANCKPCNQDTNCSTEVTCINDTDPGSESISGFCGTKACIKIAQTLKMAMDSTQDPCADFYSYACGNFMNTTTVPANGITGPFYSADDNFRAKVYRILDLGLAEESDIDATATAIKLYTQCNSQENEEDSGLAYLNEMLDSFAGGWPISKKDWTPKTFRWDQSAAMILRELSHNAVFRIALFPDKMNSSKYMILFVPSQIILEKFLQNENIPTTVTKGNIKKIVCIINPNCDQNPELEQDISDLDAYLNTQHGQYSAKTKYSLDISRVDSSGPFPNFTAFSIDDLAKLIPVVNWKSFFEVVFRETGYEIKDDFQIYTLKEVLTEFVKRITGFPERFQANSIGWKLITEFGGIFSKQITALLYPQQTQRERCYKLVNDVMGYAVGRLYINEFLPREARVGAKGIMDDLMKAFTDLMIQSKWMDESTKTSALKKIKKMVGSVASPSWVFSDDKLNARYQKIISSRTANFTKMFQEAKKLYFENKAVRLTRPIDRENDWIKDTPIETNAFYYRLTNSIFFPLGILQYPFFTVGRPRAVNYGSLGYVAGHEVTHGFDATGKSYDETGFRKNWWSADASAVFDQGAQCFIKQYSSINDSLTNTNLNGTFTLSEDIADNGGIRTAFWAYKKFSQQQRGGLKGLENLTEDQLFFLSAGHTWCTKTNAETMNDKIKTDDHSPNMYRAIVPFQNLPEFSKAFNCKAETFMNPKDRCNIW